MNLNLAWLAVAFYSRREGEGEGGEALAWLTEQAVSLGQLIVSVFNFFKYDSNLIYC